MTEPSVVHRTFTLERTYRAAPDRVFEAFKDPTKKQRWFVEGKGWELDEFTSEFRVNGHERSRFRFIGGADAPEGAPPSGTPMANETVYLDIVPNRRIVFAYSMSVNDTPFSASLATIELRPKGTGTEVVLTEQGAFYENSDGSELREQGWRELLEQLEQELSRG